MEPAFALEVKKTTPGLSGICRKRKSGLRICMVRCGFPTISKTGVSRVPRVIRQPPCKISPMILLGLPSKMEILYQSPTLINVQDNLKIYKRIFILPHYFYPVDKRHRKSFIHRGLALILVLLRVFLFMILFMKLVFHKK